MSKPKVTIKPKKTPAQRRKSTIELELKEMELVEKKLSVAKLQRDHDKEVASAKESLVYTFYTEVDDKSVRKCMDELGSWSRRCPKANLDIILNSPGGFVIDGFTLYDYIRMLSLRGHHVTITTFGQASSMGSIILQAADKRVLGRNARVLIHEVSGHAYGFVSTAEERVVELKREWQQCISILAARSVMSEDEIRDAARKTDWLLSAHEAVELGFADEVI